MDARTFFNIVAEMREQQDKFFKTRSQAAFRESRRLERIVDAEIARVKSITNPPVEEQKLF
ncbi:MAG: hypothetical protein IJQ79_02720 [Bacteroidales bacterium]|nr:hypothetical protein [Bacteroidales bacterium]